MAARSRTKAPAKKKTTKSTSTRAASAKAKAKAPARKAAAAKKTAARKPAAKKSAPPAKKIGPVIRTKLRKNEVIALISDETSVPKEQVRAVLEKREELIERALKPRSVGIFQDGSLVKFERYRRKATKKRIGRNLKTDEPIEIPPKPAQNAVKVKKLTKLKRMVSS